MLVCDNCGKLIEDDELGYGYEPHGERTPNCCSCGGDFIEATKCRVCGEHFDSTHLHGVCEGCLEEYETVGEALAIGEENTENIEVNGFVANVLSQDLINKILTKWVEENFVDHSKAVVDYCEDDKSYFADWIADKYGD